MRKALSKVVYDLTNIKKKKNRPAAVLTMDWSERQEGIDAKVRVELGDQLELLQ